MFCTDINISLLKENGILNVNVSNVKLLGEQYKHMNLWETALRVSSKTDRKETYIVTANSPAEAEREIVDYLQLNVSCNFELKKVGQVEYHKVVKLYDTEVEEYEKDGLKRCKWFKVQVYSTVQDEEDGSEQAKGGGRNLLVLATTFENALQATKLVLNKNEYDEIYNTFKNVQELNLEGVFLPDENAVYYSNEELDQ